jgi:hypothetical protein
MGEVIDFEDARLWKRAKRAWQASSARVRWEDLPEEQRLQYKRDFAASESRLRNRFEGR